MKIKQILRSHVIIFFGLFCTAVGWGVFLIPGKVVGGGISGIAAITYYAFHFPPVSVTYFIINLILILLSMKVINIKFGLKSVFGVTVFSLLLAMFEHLIEAPPVNDPLLTSLIGGILSGIGVGIVFSQGASSGGTDLIAMMVTSRRNISPGRVLMMIDVIVITSSYFALRSTVENPLERMIYGYCVMATSGYVVDFVLAGSKQSYQLFIFSNKYEQVAENISSNVKRGITLVDAQGWYSRKNTKMIMVIVRKHEVTQVFRAIKEIDPDSFISLGNVMGVYGNGFDTIKVKC
jgi:uncharacterized membrane-anchored protein YitT (DUF2179 family)